MKLQEQEQRFQSNTCAAGCRVFQSYCIDCDCSSAPGRRFQYLHQGFRSLPWRDLKMLVSSSRRIHVVGKHEMLPQLCGQHKPLFYCTQHNAGDAASWIWLRSMWDHRRSIFAVHLKNEIILPKFLKYMGGKCGYRCYKLWTFNSFSVWSLMTRISTGCILDLEPRFPNFLIEHCSNQMLVIWNLMPLYSVNEFAE